MEKADAAHATESSKKKVTKLAKSGMAKSSKESVQRANQYKLNKEWLQAGHEFASLAARKAKKSKRSREHEAANYLSDASNCYVKVDPRYAIICLQFSAKLYAQMGEFSISARHHESIAELADRLERKNQEGVTNWKSIGGEFGPEFKEINKKLEKAIAPENKTKSVFKIQFRSQSSKKQLDLQCSEQSKSTPQDLAMQHLEKAASYYDVERSPACAASCLEKRARLMADTGDLTGAGDEFCKLKEHAMNDSMLSLGVRDYVFRACLCKLAAHRMSEDAGQPWEGGELVAELGQSDEGDLIRALSEAEDIGGIGEAISEFERLNTLDDWSRRRVDQIRNSIAGKEAAFHPAQLHSRRMAGQNGRISTSV